MRRSPRCVHTTRPLARRNQAIGECWRADASADGNAHVFISPVLAGNDAGACAHVLETLAHELVHAAVGHELQAPWGV